MNIKLIVLALTCVSLGAQEDPGGWTKAKWGMTDAQIYAAFPEAHWINDKLGVNFGLEHFPVRSIPCTVYFIFKSDKGTLNRVYISTDQSTEKRAAYASVGRDLLLDSLREKYGEPTSKKSEFSSGALIRTWEWLLPQTSITLTNWENSYTGLEYHKREKAAGI